MLGFGLRHVCQVEGGRGRSRARARLRSAELKGSNAIIYRAVHALGLESVLYLYCEPQPADNKFAETGLIVRVLQLEGCEEVENLISTLPMVDPTSTTVERLCSLQERGIVGLAYGDVLYSMPYRAHRQGG